MIKFRYENHGSIVLARPLNRRSRAWVRRTAPDNAQFFGEALAIEPRYVADFCMHVRFANTEDMEHD